MSGDFSNEPALEFMQHLWALNHAVERTSLRMERELGVTAQQRLVLRCVGKYPGMMPTQVAALLHLDRGDHLGDAWAFGAAGPGYAAPRPSRFAAGFLGAHQEGACTGATMPGDGGKRRRGGAGHALRFIAGCDQARAESHHRGARTRSR